MLLLKTLNISVIFHGVSTDSDYYKPKGQFRDLYWNNFHDRDQGYITAWPVFIHLFIYLF